MVDRVSRSQTKKEIQERQRAWLREVMSSHQVKPSQLAEGASVSDTTISRLLNNPDYTGTLSQETIDRIKEAYRVPGPEEYAAGRRLSALTGLSEAERFGASGETPQLQRVVEAMLANRPGVDPWRLKTSALESVGFLPGDIVLVDLNAEARTQDAVCAQVYDWARGRAETVWRIYDPPFLVGAAHDRTSYKPILVDNDRVVIKGVVVESIRPHRLSSLR